MQDEDLTDQAMRDWSVAKQEPQGGMGRPATFPDPGAEGSDPTRPAPNAENSQ
jgi:hypothetical protein